MAIWIHYQCAVVMSYYFYYSLLLTVRNHLLQFRHALCAVLVNKDKTKQK